MAFDIVSVGNINVDLSFRLSRVPGKDQEVFSEDFKLAHGGSAANVAFAASRLGLRVAMLGCVGDDPWGEEAVAELERAGVDCAGVKRVIGAKTGTVCVMVDGGGHRSMVAFRGANGNLRSALDSGVPEAKVLHLSNVSKPVLLKARAVGKNHRVSCDPGGGAGEMGIDPLNGLEILLLNEEECASLTGLRLGLGVSLLAGKVGNVVVKRGKRGAVSAAGHLRFRQPSFDVPVIDATGAGDAFDAGYLLGAIEGRGLARCLALGQAVAALKIGGWGARSNLPSRHDLDRFLEKNKWKKANRSERK